MQIFNQTVRAALFALVALCWLAGASGLAHAQVAQTSDEWLKSFQQMLQANDAVAARASLEARVATGDPVALSEQGDALRTGSIYAKDLNRAFAVLQQAALAGNVWSMSVVGLMLRDGEGRAQDWPGAIAWFQRAADAGHAWSANEVGFAHELGKGGLKVNHIEALKWYLKAAEGGEPMAMTNAGLYYQYGSPGVPVDVEKARVWYEKAMQAGYEPARPRLASLPSKQTAQQPTFVPRPLGPKPEQTALFSTALRAAAQMGFKADTIDNDTCEAQLRHNYQGTEVKFSLSVPVVGRLRGSIRVLDDNIREGFIRLYRQELVKALNGAQIELDGNISGR